MPLTPSDIGGFGSGFGGFITPAPIFQPQPITTQPAAPPVAAQPIAPAPEPTPIFGGFDPAPPDIGGYIIPDAPMIRPPDSVTGIGSDYPFTDGVPTATPSPSNGFSAQPVDRIPFIIDSPSFFSPITYPEDIHYLPQPDPVPASPVSGGLTPPSVPSDIGGFIPDMPDLPVILPPASAPSNGTTDGTGDSGTGQPQDIVTRLADLMAQQFAGGGGGSSGGVAALPVGIAPTQASSGSVLPLLIIGGLVVGGIWYFRRKKGAS